MRYWRYLCACAASACWLAVARAESIPDYPTAAGPAAVPGELVVVMKPGAALSGSRAHARVALRPAALGRAHNGAAFYRVRVRGDVAIADALAAYRADPQVQAVSLNYLKYPAATPNDPEFAPMQWGLVNTQQFIRAGSYAQNNPGVADADVDASEAWDVVRAGVATVIAVIDTGIDYTHPELADAMWDAAAARFNGGARPSPFHGYDFGDGDADPYPLNDVHGTHVAGIVGASGDNGIGITGIAAGAKIMALKVFADRGGGASNAAIIAAINYAVENGAHVINMSLSGGGAEDPVLTAAVQGAVANGVLVVVAAGNDGRSIDDTAVWPARYAGMAATQAGVLAVMASDQADARAGFSNFGRDVGIAAPGTNILSTVTGRTLLQSEPGSGFGEGSARSCVGNAYRCFDNTVFNGSDVDCQGARCRWGWRKHNGRMVLAADTESADAGRYLAGSDGTLQSRALDTRGARRVVLRYQASWDLACDRDYVDVQVWTGTVWQTLSAPQFNLNANGSGYCRSQHTHTGGMASLFPPQWIAHDVSAYAHAHFKVRLVYGTAGAYTTRVPSGFQLWDFIIDAQTEDYRYAYAVKSGTSMAAPLVAGIAALLKTYRSEYRAADLKNAVKNGADTIIGSGGMIARANAYSSLFAPTAAATGEVAATAAPATTATPTLAADGGGGCALTPRASFDVTLLLLAGVSVCAACRRRARTRRAQTSPPPTRRR